MVPTHHVPRVPIYSFLFADPLHPGEMIFALSMVVPKTSETASLIVSFSSSGPTILHALCRRTQVKRVCVAFY
jgi:hypothetical protein